MKPTKEQIESVIIKLHGYDVIIDKSSFDFVSKYKWFFSISTKGTSNIYFRRSVKLGNGKWGKVALHRELLGVTDGSLCVDHINGNTLDNRISNLRIATKSQNGMNSKVKKNSPTGITGVVPHRNTGRFIAQISVNRKNIYLGMFDDINSAIECRKKYEEEYFGEYARK
jgi:hypothetical protein